MSVQELRGIADTSTIPTDKVFLWLGGLGIAYLVVRLLFGRKPESPP